MHHTADSNSYSAEDVPRILRSIYAYHAVTLGWGDIGYNVVVDKFGRAWEGRAGGLASTVVGAHAGGFNTGTFGISMLGNYDVTAVPQAVVETVANVVAWKFSLYGIDPRGTVTLTSGGGGTARYAKGQSVTLPTLFAHRDVGSTACPGRYGFSRMGELRSLVAQRTTVAAAVSPTGPRTLLRNSTGGGLAEWTTTRGDVGDIPFACDWDGNGNQTIGIFRAGLVHVFNSNASTARADYSFRFGDAGDIPLCGDWDGDGKDTIGIWRQGVFFLKNANSTGIADGVFPFGNRDAQPVVGDWNGDGHDTVGVYQNATFYWADSNLRPYADGQQPFGDRGDVVVVGDWNGKGRDTFGVFRAGKFLLATSLARAQADLKFSYGDRNDTPVTADWNGDGTTTVGIIRDY
ncbi:hypothetical protein A7K94_0204310 [Modestobacter sp. VKM Ac-2676]|nr:hypothetical protein A7K94_0204310 [Modestobacter sp. VKM Ac-2676]